MSPATRRRLQACFEHGSKSAAKGDYDYATDMFTQCVLGDPANLIYAQQFLGNLFKKYNNNKKGSKLASIQGVTTRGSIKKASMSKDWPGVIKSGLDFLKLNPWDVSTLLAIANACSESGYDDAQLAYLKAALEADNKNVDVNRQYARALAAKGQFDQAIACWKRVLQLKPQDEEALRASSNLDVSRTIHKGGYEDAESSNDLKADKSDEYERRSGIVPLSPEQKLEKAIAKDPANLSQYLDLADLHTSNGLFEEAEKVLQRALDASGGEMSMRERLEDAQLRRGRHQLAIAEKRAQEEKTEQAAELAKRMKLEFNRLEIEVYRSRSDRYPTNLGYKFELGLRLKKAGQFNDAIQCFQAARGDAKRKAQVHLELGECFQHIKQYKLAIGNYETAIEAVSDREPDLRKLALYRAGVLAFGMKDMDPAQNYLGKAEKYLTELASLEFGYKDVPERLDKIARLRNKE